MKSLQTATLLLIITLSILTSCTSKVELVGKYETNAPFLERAFWYLQGARKFPISKLELRSDSTYTQKWCGSPKEGKWTIQGDKLVLLHGRDKETWLKDVDCFFPYTFQIKNGRLLHWCNDRLELLRKLE